MAEGHAEHHWEYSIFPFIVTWGVTFAVPLAFAAYFEYGSALLTAIFLGIGVPLLVVGVAGWTSEGIRTSQEHGWAMTGLPIFIVSETMIFLSLFASYWMFRLTTQVWPPEGSPEIGIGLPIIMTIILVSSSMTYHKAEDKLEAGDTSGFKSWVIISMVLGLLFLGCTIYEYNHLIHQGFTFSTNAKSTAFYSITGFHASHVLVGLCIFLAVLIPALSGKISKTFVKGAGLYWHFVDVIWFFVVSQIYFW